jgi:hypothetical protein
MSQDTKESKVVVYQYLPGYLEILKQRINPGALLKKTVLVNLPILPMLLLRN